MRVGYILSELAWGFSGSESINDSRPRERNLLFYSLFEDTEYIDYSKG